MNSGTLTLNGVTDPQLISILEVKEAHEDLIHFEPELMRPENVIPPRPGPGQPGYNPYLPVPPVPPQTGPKPWPVYDNVVIGWNGDDGLAAVAEILKRMSDPQVQPPQAGPQH